MTDLTYDKDRFDTDPSYRDGALDGIQFMMAVEEREKAETSKAGYARYKELTRKRMIGWENDSAGCFFWFVGWDCWSLGFHICFGAPNIEIHIPFGFVRIGWHSGRKHIKELREAADA